MIKQTSITELIGLTMTRVTMTAQDELIFVTDSKREFRFYHAQSCCESVTIEDVVGDLSDLVGAPILQADEASSSSNGEDDCYNSYTWTFYKFATVKGYVTIRWYGTSNGCYSESVNFEEVLCI